MKSAKTLIWCGYPEKLAIFIIEHTFP